MLAGRGRKLGTRRSTETYSGVLCGRAHDSGGGMSLRLTSSGHCIECERLRQTAHREDAWRRRGVLFGELPLQWDDFVSCLAFQGGQCATCKTRLSITFSPRPDADHEHETGQFRGVCCSRCNGLLSRYESGNGLPAMPLLVGAFQHYMYENPAVRLTEVLGESPRGHSSEPSVERRLKGSSL
jgi:hypothetical protein